MTSNAKTNFPKALKYYLNINGKKQQDLIDDLSISSSTVSQWITGKMFPRMDKIETLAKYLGVSTSDLLSDPYEKQEPAQKTKQAEPYMLVKLLESNQSLRELLHVILLLQEDDIVVLKAVAERLHNIQKDK